jgi:hypothetical protein
MPRVRGPRLHLQTAALIAVGALAVHELRVVAGYGHDAELIMGAPGHAYLPFATGLVVVLLALSAMQFAHRMIRAAAGSPVMAHRASFRARWLGTSVLLVAVYLAQATAESFFDPGHPIVGHGGWSVVPLALAVAGAIVVLTGAADRAVMAIAAPPISRIVVTGPAQAVAVAPSPVAIKRPAPLASRSAGRAPPLVA